MIHVIAIITAKSGQRAELLDAFAQIIPLVHAEQGCIEYQPVIDVDDGGPMQSLVGPDSFVVIEKWESMDALKAHAASSHMAQYGESAGHMVADRTIHILSQTV